MPNTTNKQTDDSPTNQNDCFYYGDKAEELENIGESLNFLGRQLKSGWACDPETLACIYCTGDKRLPTHQEAQVFLILADPVHGSACMAIRALGERIWNLTHDRGEMFRALSYAAMQNVIRYDENGKIIFPIKRRYDHNIYLTINDLWKGIGYW